MIMKNLKLNLVFALFFVSAISVGQVQSYDDFNAATDGTVDQNSFNEGFTDNYDQWDTDGDGAINDQEFYSTTYNRLDQNQDGTLTEEEWQEGYDNIYGDYAADMSYDQLDADRDGSINEDEFYTGFRDTDYYDSYDADGDGNIDSDELSEGVFTHLDNNADGRLDREEYDTYSSYYIDTY